ncbi:MAG TPA: sigma factor-like helix-turn-helix DNA-binding protein [Methylocystis sp.]|nr:sigma factor-like helix-turn-helix DNA-binding protein [Methylocystis sp.]
MGQKEDVFLHLEAATPALRRYARALGVSMGTAAADDLVQTAIGRVAARLRAKELRDAEAVRLAAYQLLTALAREKLCGHPEAGFPPRRSALARGLADLPFEERAALLLVVLEGLSYDATAQVVHTPREAVVMRLMRARAALAPLDLRPSSAPHDGVRRGGAHLRVVK